MKLIAKTLYGLEKVLAEELEGLGATNIQQVNRAVLCSGNRDLLYRANYSLRSALSVLVNISEFRIRSKDDLYNGTLKINWLELMGPDSSFSVSPVVNSPIFTHTGYPALVVKDAIADYFRSKTGRRPAVAVNDPEIIINLHISNDQVSLSLDSSGPSLFKRGYRIEQGPAPINEVLAAGILLLSGWNCESSLLDPMCGSGTIPIEAALIACRIPAGRLRKTFGFTRWKEFDPGLFERIKKEADSRIRKSPVKITGNDLSEIAVKNSLANIKNAGLEGEVEITTSDFRNSEPSDRPGYIFINPPYGQRLNPDELGGLYSMIGTTLKHKFAGSRAWIITPDKEYLKNIGLKPESKRILFNGSLECLLSEFKMYEGSVKHTGNARMT